MVTTTEQARQTLAQLEQKIAAASAREIEIAHEGRRLSFDAHSGDEAAKKALSKLDADELKLRLEQRHLRDALQEAQRRLAEAEQAEGQASQAEKAKGVGRPPISPKRRPRAS